MLASMCPPCEGEYVWFCSGGCWFPGECQPGGMGGLLGSLLLGCAGWGVGFLFNFPPEIKPKRFGCLRSGHPPSPVAWGNHALKHGGHAFFCTTSF